MQVRVPDPLELHSSFHIEELGLHIVKRRF